MDFLYFAIGALLVIYAVCAIVGAVKFLRDLHEFHPYKAQVNKLVKAHAYLKDIVAHEDYMSDSPPDNPTEKEDAKDEICES